ncbi:hypothetical protein PpBr36_01983 [Pyricularia pennisetigena]|uniref:hypothetical protein n=1 Tax=Pyricularia pennisetigena TaxID=1578925 RepID=UPI00114D61DA|nr:hypothetical protein PpBr36_01983 [Pyricularia pennisetigena]TLS28132.1 hypothetical protein PpBr36_01983 [Pyricularia pennisetigena]
MSSIRRTVHESLPYVDPDPTPTQRAAAEALVAAELEASSATTTASHPDLPPAYTSNFTPAIAAELDRISSSADPSRPTKLSAIDTKRYELDDDEEEEDGQPAQTSESLALTLSKAYTSATHIRLRRHHLALLDAPEGRNAWLVANWQLEGELRALEAELAAAKRQVDVLAIQRRRAQDDVAGELRGLEDSWKRGVGQVLEIEVATHRLRSEVEARRNEALAAQAAAGA